MGRMLIWMGGMLLLLGLLWEFGGRFLSIGRLPGDIVIQRGNFTFYFPLMTSILLSLLLSAALWLFRRF
ncbi:MAG TPA: DUF2905 domain-containing protein [Symbiobacteriaceae bacterium]